MGTWEYFLILITIPAYVKIGSYLLKTSSSHARLLAALMVMGSIGEILLRMAPNLLRIFYLSCVIGGSLLLAADLIRRKSKFDVQIVRSKNFGILTFSTLFALFFFSFFHYKNFPYESHQVLYFDAVIEGFRADYFGNIRVSAFYPNERAALHLTPGAFLGALAVFLKSPNLINLVEIKFILISIFFGDFIRRIAIRRNVWLSNLSLYHVPINFVGIALSMIIFGNFFNYNLYISSFCYVFLIMHILMLSIEGEAHTNEFIFFCIATLLTKTTIIPFTLLFILVSLIIAIRKNGVKKLWNLNILLIGSIFLANVILWKTIPQGQEKIVSMELIFPKTLADFSGISPFSDPLIDMISGESFKFSYGIFVFTFLSFFMLLIDKKFALKIVHFSIYMGTFLLALLFFRLNGDLSHVRHVYFFSGIVACVAFALFAQKWLFAYIFILFVGIFCLLKSPDPYYRIPYYTNDMKIKFADYNFMSFQEFEKSDAFHLRTKSSSEFYSPPLGEPYWKSEMYSSMLGLRLRREDVTPDYGQNMLWILH